MLKFIWNSWWRNKERFILLLVGVLIVSTGLSYLIGTTQANNGTVVDELQKRWGSSYDIVVRPEGSRSVTEDLKLLEPNYMSGLDGGITRKQYETIKKVTDVEVAAPIAMIGYNQTVSSVGTHTIDQEGIYKLTIKDTQDTGLQNESSSGVTYLAAGWEPTGDAKKSGVSPLLLGKQPLFEYGSQIMIAGVDPEAEAALVGLDQATTKGTYSNYFSKDDQVISFGEDGVQIPILLNNREYVDASRIYTYEKVELPSKKKSINDMVQQVEQKGGKEYLDSLPTSDAKRYTITTQDVQKKLVNDILKHTLPTAEETNSNSFTWIALKPSPIDYRSIKSPYASRWPFTYQVQPKQVDQDSLLAKRSMYREARMFGKDSVDWPKVNLNYIGVFDPKKLNISKDPLTELPMETYFPSKAQWVMDKNERPVNPVRDVKPTNDPYDFLTKPPSMLTTLDAAFKIRGDKAISAIRVNVKGVETMNAASEKKLQQVTTEIEQKTGLITDVTLGSSPQLALTYLPGLKDESALGWVQQPWIKLGSSIAIFQEAKVGMSGIIASVIAVALVYVFSSNIILLYARKKEFAILLSLGWRPRQLSKLLFLEATILGTFVVLIAWTILGSFWVTTDNPIAIDRILLIGLAGLLIYWGGTLVPMTLIRRIKPYESMRSGEVSKGRRFVRARSVLGMSTNQLVTYWQRTGLSVVAIALPTSLFIFFLFITFRLKGVLYATWLGEYVALEVGTMHYVAMGVALLIAILTTTEIMWQNVNERKSQLAVLKATGWQDVQIRLLVLSEGMMTGLCAGVIGLLTALGMIGFIYGQFPVQELGFLSVMLLIPVITGVLGALLPAERAVRITPNAALGSVVENTQATERRFKWALGSIAASLCIGVASLFLFASTESSTTTPQSAPQQQTNGQKLKDLASDTTTSADKKTTKQEAALKKLMKKGVIQTYPGDPEAKYELFYAKSLAPTPKDLNLKEKPGYRYVTIPVFMHNSDTQSKGAYSTYRPGTFTLTSLDGKEYSTVDYVNHNEKAFKNGYQYFAPYESLVDLVYQVPVDKKTFVLYAADEAFPKNTTVKVELD
ncbi:ABC transporter permease [Exiguobacterium sp. RIT341]|uniref:ABC transporter permease n=1 Tax=Exiguobacterium sp. RIT341 TaxID=1470592 RepID=UPI00044C2E6D|nr:ABC transporter permease [Exiguobacterium sp. RIT341]EZP61297.1 acidobacterial duplicated orphan permease [Exiguobacterium sp. RIT341]